MSPAGLLTLLVLVPTAAAVSGSDFSNNLFTDLAPLIALFGEQVSKQFLSQSLTPYDAWLFAVAPLGIITGVVSAIRLSKYTWLKAIVGRAVEPKGAAGLELTSATSSDICELWDGKSVVRVLGQPSILTVAYTREQVAGSENSTLSEIDSDEDDPLLEDDETEVTAMIERDRLLDFETAKQKRFLRSSQTPLKRKRLPRKRIGASWNQDENNAPPQNENPPPPPPAIPPIPPNLSLNITTRVSNFVLISATLLGTIIQLAPLAVAFVELTRTHPVSAYHSKASSTALFVAGTLFVVFGLYACALSIVKSTRTEFWNVAKGGQDDSDMVDLVWLQPQQVVNDQTFPSSAIYPKKQSLVLSYIEEDESRHQMRGFVPLIGIGMSLIGFIIQFIGLRGMSWTISIAQLGAMMCNTLIRVFVKLPFSKPTESQVIDPKMELEWLTFKIHGRKRWLIRSTPSNMPSFRSQPVGNSLVETLTSRIKLGKMAREVRWKLPRGEEAMMVKMTAESLLNCLWSSSVVKPSSRKALHLQWSFYSHFNDVSKFTPKVPWNSQTTCNLSASRRSHPGGLSKWTLELEELEAFLSLWIHDLINIELPKWQTSLESTSKADDKQRDIYDDIDNDNEEEISTSLDELLTYRQYLWALAPISPLSSLDFDTWIRKSNHAFHVEDKSPHLGFLATDGIMGLRSPQCECSPDQWKPGAHSATSDQHVDLLAMLTYSTLPLLCGRYLLASLLRFAAAHLLPIPSPASIKGEPSFGIDTIRAENAWIDSVIGALTEHNLMNEQDALAIIVPALRERNLMPSLSLNQQNQSIENTMHLELRYAHAFAGINLWKESVASLHHSRAVFDRNTETLNEVSQGLWQFSRSLETFVQGQQHVRLILDDEILQAQSHSADSITNATTCSPNHPGEEDFSKIMQRVRKNHDVNFLMKMLRVAVKSGNTTVVLLSLMTGMSDPRMKVIRTELNDLLITAVEIQNHNILKMLLAYSGKPVVINELQRNPLFAAAETNDFASIEVMISAGLSAESRGVRGQTLLQFAAAVGNFDLVQHLVKLGAKVNVPVARFQQSALAAAIKSDTPDIVEYLLNNGAEPNPPLRQGSNPMELSIRNGLEMVKIMVKHGADVDSLVSTDGITAIQFAKQEGRFDIVQYLEEKGADCTPNPMGPKATNFDPERKHKRNHPNALLTWTDLQIAASDGNEVRVETLLQGQSVNAAPVVLCGRTALQAAAEAGHDAVVSMLIPLADVNQQPAEVGGITALQGAAQNGHLSIVRQLLQAGADVNHPAGVEFGTALQLASGCGHLLIVKELLQAGADLEAPGPEISGLSASQAAEKAGRTDVLALLSSPPAPVTVASFS